MKDYKMFDEAMEQAQAEHRARQEVIRNNAERMRNGYILEQDQISRSLFHQKVAALKDAHARGVLQEALGN